jgi:hypothetical protein
VKAVVVDFEKKVEGWRVRQPTLNGNREKGQHYVFVAVVRDGATKVVWIL